MISDAILKYQNLTIQSCDVLIIGSGAAGLACALKLAQLNDKLKIIVVAKSSAEQNSTWLAQGGIATVNIKGDSFQSHIEDTLACGSFLNRKQVVETIIQSAPDVLSWLVDLGMPFSRHKDQFHLHQEGGHQFRRIFHFEDATGRALQEVLIKNSKLSDAIEVIDHQFLLDLIKQDGQIVGAKFLNQVTQMVEVIQAKKVVIASGGACNIYQYASSSITATGDGIAAGYRLGATITNLEFTQFHPTCFFNQSARNLLLTEALRGEGAVLRLSSGQRFMPNYDQKAELAPRDIVARAIDTELKLSGEDCVYLDISAKPAKKVKLHFPMLYRELKKYGYDLTKDPIPVVPAAHYFCGGIETDINAKTNLTNLYAIGEAAHTGLHGANRLASNSLLECLVMGHRSAIDIENSITDQSLVPVDCTEIELKQGQKKAEKVIIKHLWDQVRQSMSNYVGIMRTTHRLELAMQTIETIEKEMAVFKEKFSFDQDYLELENLVCISRLTIECALMRKESRGLHFNQDYPNQSESIRDSVVKISC